MTERQAIQNAMNRYVAIKNGDQACSSGVIISSGYVLTCFHCLHAGEETKVGGKKATPIAVDPVHDLALLSVPTKRFPLVVLGGVNLAEAVFFVSNPNGFSGVLMFCSGLSTSPP